MFLDSMTDKLAKHDHYTCRTLSLSDKKLEFGRDFKVIYIYKLIYKIKSHINKCYFTFNYPICLYYLILLILIL